MLSNTTAQSTAGPFAQNPIININQNLQMNQRYFVLIDTTQESIAPTFRQNPIFNTWLNSYDTLAEALEFIVGIRPAQSLNIFVARDNILDNVQLPGTNGPMRTLIETFCGLNTIQHVTILCPTTNIELEQQIHGLITDLRLLNNPVSINGLHMCLCTTGIQHLTEQISYRISTGEIQLIGNLRRNIGELMEYCKDAMNDQNRMLDTVEEAHSNRPGAEPSESTND